MGNCEKHNVTVKPIKYFPKHHRKSSELRELMNTFIEKAMKRRLNEKNFPEISLDNVMAAFLIAAVRHCLPYEEL